MESTTIAKVLGGTKVLRKTIRNQMDLIRISERGLPKIALIKLAQYLLLPVPSVIELLAVTERTVQRYGPEDHFNSTISEQILQIASIVARGTEVLGDKERLLTWFKQPNQALGSQTPISLLRSRFGAEMVLDELGRIEHGVIS